MISVLTKLESNLVYEKLLITFHTVFPSLTSKGLGLRVLKAKLKCYRLITCYVSKMSTMCTRNKTQTAVINMVVKRMLKHTSSEVTVN